MTHAFKLKDFSALGYFLALEVAKSSKDNNLPNDTQPIWNVSCGLLFYFFWMVPCNNLPNDTQLILNVALGWSQCGLLFFC